MSFHFFYLVSLFLWGLKEIEKLLPLLPSFKDLPYFFLSLSVLFPACLDIYYCVLLICLGNYLWQFPKDWGKAVFLQRASSFAPAGPLGAQSMNVSVAWRSLDTMGGSI